MRRIIQVISIALLMLCQGVNVLAKTHVVDSRSSFVLAHSAAVAGDTIIWKQGLYYDININISKDQLIFIAEIPGKTVFTGASKIYINGDDNTFSGFQYLEGSIGSSGVVVELRGSRNHLTQINIKDYYCAKYVVIKAGCSENVLSYCNLENKTYNGDKNILSILRPNRSFVL